MNKIIRVLVADDHGLFREGIRRLLQEQEGIEVVGEAADGTTAVRLAQELAPDLVLMDITMDGMNGIEATRRVLEHRPNARVLILTMHDNEKYIDEVLEAGAAGYLLKDTPGEEFVAAIRAVHRGDSYLSPAISRKVLDGLLRHRRDSTDRPAAGGLTRREREVLTLLAEGKSNRAVATELGISPKTVDVHRTNIMRKLDIHSIVHLVKYAIQRGLVQA